MGYPEDIIERIWQKAETVEGYNPAVMRKDMFGAWIIRNHYDNRHSEYSWEIDLIDTTNKERLNVDNMRPLQWENKSFRRGGDFLGQVTSMNVNNMRVK